MSDDAEELAKDMKALGSYLDFSLISMDDLYKLGERMAIKIEDGGLDRDQAAQETASEWEKENGH